MYGKSVLTVGEILVDSELVRDESVVCFSDLLTVEEIFRKAIGRS